MVLQTPTPTRPATRPATRPPHPRRHQGLLALAVLLGVVVLDQGTKWWAWRHVFAVVNAGSTWFLGGEVSGWFADRLGGALLDVVSVEALTLGAFLLLRRPRPHRVLVPALMMIGGWGSNLLDRLGLHLLTAPGKGRGAVDFIPLGHFYYNLADVVIVVGTALCLAAAVWSARRNRPGAREAAPAPRPWRGAWRWALVAALAPVLLGTAATLTSPRPATVAETPVPVHSSSGQG